MRSSIVGMLRPFAPQGGKRSLASKGVKPYGFRLVAMAVRAFSTSKPGFATISNITSFACLVVHFPSSANCQPKSLLTFPTSFLATSLFLNSAVGGSCASHFAGPGQRGPWAIPQDLCGDCALDGGACVLRGT